MRAAIIARHSQRAASQRSNSEQSASPPPSPLPRSMSPPTSFQPPRSMPSAPTTPLISSNSAENLKGSSPSDSKTEEPQRSKRVRVPTLKLVEKSPQQPKKASKATKRRKLGKKALQAAREMSQLLDSYAPPPSSTVILGRVSIESIQ
jgi:hypothetical protein